MAFGCESRLHAMGAVAIEVVPLRAFGAEVASLVERLSRLAHRRTHVDVAVAVCPALRVARAGGSHRMDRHTLGDVRRVVAKQVVFREALGGGEQLGLSGHGERTAVADETISATGIVRL